MSNALNAVLQEAPSAGGSAGDALAMVSTQPKDVPAFLTALLVDFSLQLYFLCLMSTHRMLCGILNCISS